MIQYVACPIGCPIDDEAQVGDICLCGSVIEKTCLECGEVISDCFC